MLGKHTVLAAGAVITGLLLPAQAMAQYDAHTRADLNLRVGPGTNYGVIDVIPAGYPVDVLGCLDDYEWCDVDWDGLRGWVSARYLVQPGTTVYLPQVAPRIGVPIVTFSFITYHDRHYHGLPWHRKRHGRWHGHDLVDDSRDRDRAEERRERRDREEAERLREQRDAERVIEQRETERPRQQREAERPRKQRQVEQPQQQREMEQPHQQRQVEQPQQQRQADRPRRGERTQRQGRPSEGQRIQRQGSGATERAIIKERGR